MVISELYQPTHKLAYDLSHTDYRVLGSFAGPIAQLEQQVHFSLMAGFVVQAMDNAAH